MDVAAHIHVLLHHRTIEGAGGGNGAIINNYYRTPAQRSCLCLFVFWKNFSITVISGEPLFPYSRAWHPFYVAHFGCFSLLVCANAQDVAFLLLVCLGFFLPAFAMHHCLAWLFIHLVGVFFPLGAIFVVSAVTVHIYPFLFPSMFSRYTFYMHPFVTEATFFTPQRNKVYLLLHLNILDTHFLYASIYRNHSFCLPHLLLIQPFVYLNVCEKYF